MSKPKKQVFSKVKAVKANARDRVGAPRPEPKHKPTFADMLNSTGDDQ
jgi:hypothetical protein